MEKFAEIFNKLQSIMNVVKTDIEFPQIVVVGSQSDGKSSVLEGIVKQDFLPRGADVVTRTPIILQLRRAKRQNPDIDVEYVVSYKVPSSSSEQTSVSKSFTNSEQVARAITAATVILAGNNKDIVDQPITVTVYSPDVPDLTLVDLPGLIESRAGDQPEDIKKKVELLVHSYLSNSSAIILAVHPATTDLANGKSLSMAREVDPEGKRTLCVVTKLDLVEEGDSKTELLSGRQIERDYTKVRGTIGVVNVSTIKLQATSSLSRKDRESHERRFFEDRYPIIAQQHGTRVLTDHLAKLFHEHVKHHLPALKASVDMEFSSYTKELESLGKPERARAEGSDPNQSALDYDFVVRTINDFVNHFGGSLKGETDEGSSEIKGGSRVQQLFISTYWTELDNIVPLKDTNESRIYREIQNAEGVEPHLPPEYKAFGTLVRKEIARMKGPSVRCVALARQELLTIRDSTGRTMEDIAERYPKLHQRIVSVVGEFIEARREETRLMVSHSVAVHLDYLNVKHPDYKKAADELKEKYYKTLTKSAPTKEDGNASAPANSAATSSRTETARSAARQHRSASPRQDDEELNPRADDHIPSPVRKPTQQELELARLTMGLVRQYFNVVRLIVRDCVPKVIMHFLVSRVQEGIRTELLNKLRREEDFDTLLQEPPSMAKRRSDLVGKIELYQKAAALIQELENV